jgi:hypothetical protein
MIRGKQLINQIGTARIVLMHKETGEKMEDMTKIVHSVLEYEVVILDKLNQHDANIRNTILELFNEQQNNMKIKLQQDQKPQEQSGEIISGR